MKEEKIDIKVPTVHLNGTSREELERQYFEAARAVTQALQALAQCSPNARDYYVQDKGAFEQARKEHAARAARIETVKQELYYIHDQIVEAGDL